MNVKYPLVNKEILFIDSPYAINLYATPSKKANVPTGLHINIQDFVFLCLILSRQSLAPPSIYARFYLALRLRITVVKTRHALMAHQSELSLNIFPL